MNVLWILHDVTKWCVLKETADVIDGRWQNSASENVKTDCLDLRTSRHFRFVNRNQRFHLTPFYTAEIFSCLWKIEKTKPYKIQEKHRKSIRNKTASYKLVYKLTLCIDFCSRNETKCFFLVLFKFQYYKIIIHERTMVTFAENFGFQNSTYTRVNNVVINLTIFFSHEKLIKDKIKHNWNWRGFEYFECIPCRGETPTQKRGLLVMTLSSSWWRCSSSRDLESVKYPFIAITPRSTLTRGGSTC